MHSFTRSNTQASLQRFAPGRRRAASVDASVKPAVTTPDAGDEESSYGVADLAYVRATHDSDWPTQGDGDEDIERVQAEFAAMFMHREME